MQQPNDNLLLRGNSPGTQEIRHHLRQATAHFAEQGCLSLATGAHPLRNVGSVVPTKIVTR
jgi:hypothetical protein